MLRATALTKLALHRVLPMAAFVTCALLLAACGGNGGDGDGRVRVQLDWVPNTNHIGIYVALANGWYEEAGLDVEILPYGDQNPDTVVANNQADVAISFPANVIFSRAAGLDLVSIASILQSSPTELAVLASSDIQRPRDMDGRVYAGFGLPFEAAQVRTVIQHDGGRGEFEVATLQTFAYEALYNRQADFTAIFTTWAGIEAELRGIELRTFRYDPFGVPDYPAVIMVARASAVERDRDKLSTFMQVTQRGYEFAAQDPDAASQILLDYVPEAFPEPELVRRSTRALTEYFVANGRPWGEQDQSAWKAYTHWLIEQGIVQDRNNRTVEHEDDLPGGPLFTNVLFPGD